jgi:hypothetical protein
MKRLPFVGGAAVVAAGALASIPAVLGLAGNPSFSQQVPVRAPQHARVVVLQDSEAPRSVPPLSVPTPSQDRSARPGSGAVMPHDSREVEPGDDRSRQEDGRADSDQTDDRRGRGRGARNEDG